MRIVAFTAILWLSCSDAPMDLPSAPQEAEAAADAAGKSGTGRRRSVRAAPPSQAGTWGGEHIGLRVENGRAIVELDCAHGTIEEPIAPAGDGAFAARGTFTFERGGPITSTDVEDPRPARYLGRITGNTMLLTIEVDGQKLESFTLHRNQSPHLLKCL
jgi:hypothetical protein